MNAKQLHLMRNMRLADNDSNFKELERLRKIAHWNGIDISHNYD